jgi:hypothetical protein
MIPVWWRILFALVGVVWITGCNDPVDGYIPVKEITRNGFMTGQEAGKEIPGREISLRGYVDHGNLYGDSGARAILQEWWAGQGPDAGTWRFNLKAEPDDAVGHSFPVHVPDDTGRDKLLRVFVEDARKQKPTKLYLKGRLFTYEAPVQFSTLTALYLEVSSSQDIQLAPPGE